MMEKKHCAVDIEVDGGVKLDNLREILDAGANIIVAGSAVLKVISGKMRRSFCA